MGLKEEEEKDMNYEVIVGNIGTVYSGGVHQSALNEFTIYRRKSLAGEGRAANEPVMLLRDGEIIREYSPETKEEETSDEWRTCPNCNRTNSKNTWERFLGQCPNCGGMPMEKIDITPEGVQDF